MQSIYYRDKEKQKANNAKDSNILTTAVSYILQ